MKIAAIIPVKGREPLLYHTVRRLVSDGVEVFCVGHTESEQIVVEAAGGHFKRVKESGTTVGGKWQMALDEARMSNPDAILFLGSGDWLSHNWCATLSPYMEKFAMAGIIPAYLLHIDEGNMRMGMWGGYVGDRKNETVGLGRMFSAKFLNKIGWKLFDPALNMSIDHHQVVKVNSVKWDGPAIAVIGSDIKCLSISTYRWPNKHRFERDVSYPTSRLLTHAEMNRVLKDFPEAMNLFNE